MSIGSHQGLMVVCVKMMSKGVKEALTVLIVTHVIVLMSKLITFLIFKRFSIGKMFWKAETKTFPNIPSNALYVEGVESQNKFQYASTYIALDGMVEKV